MELRELFGYLRRWTWLLILGAVIGGGAAYAYSISQAPVYRASTKIMVIQPRESVASKISDLTDIELAETFRNLLVLQPVLQATSERIGVPVSADQISSKIIEGTLLMQVTVEDGDPNRATLIVNGLVESLIEQNDVLQAGRFEASEGSLQVQIAQVEEQIAALQREEGLRSQLSDDEVAARQLDLESSILEMTTQVAKIEEEIADLTSAEEPVILAPEERKLLDEKQAQLVLLQLNADAARKRHADLFSSGAFDGQTGDLEALVLEIGNEISVLEGEIAELTFTEEDSLQLTPEQRELLAGKQARLAVLRLSQDVSGAQYKDLLSSGTIKAQQQEQEAIILEYANQISDLEGEIADLTSNEETAQEASERQDRLRKLRAELALLQLNLNPMVDRYQQLISRSGPAGEDSGLTSQDETNLALYQQIYSSLLSDYEAVRLARVQSTPNIVQVDQAISSGPLLPNATSNALLGAAVGLIVMGTIAFLIEYLDDTLKTSDDIDNVLNLPVIGYVAQTPELGPDSKGDVKQVGPFVSNNPRAPIGEAFRSLRTNLEFSDVDRSLKTILVTSPGPGEGKTTVAANLAAAFSQQQKRVILLDCDLRRPTIHKVFDIANNNGLSNIFLGQSELQDAVHIFDGSLAVVTSGTLPSNPAELLGSDRMTQFLQTVNEMADIVVIDSPPSIVSDAAALSPKVDGVVIVIQPGSTRADDALAQLEQMHRTSARVVGVVLNRIPRKRSGYYGRYRYQYQEYYTSEDEQSSDKKRRRGRSRNPLRRLFRPFGKKSPAKQMDS